MSWADVNYVTDGVSSWQIKSGVRAHINRTMSDSDDFFGDDDMT